MSIEVTCLGGAAAWPNPGQGCSAFLVRHDETAILMDAGPDTLLELRKHINYESIDAVVISHRHSDHILDLVPYRYGLIYGVARPEKPIPIWLPPGGKHVLEDLGTVLAGKGETSDTFWDAVFSLREYDPEAGLQIGALSITFARTIHPVVCYAMRLEGSDGSTLAYTADTGTIESVLDLARGCDILISEATMPEDTDQPGSKSGHLKPSEAGHLASRAAVSTLVLSHLWSERSDEEVLAAAARSFSGHTRIAKPGLVIRGS